MGSSPLAPPGKPRTRWGRTSKHRCHHPAELPDAPGCYLHHWGPHHSLRSACPGKRGPLLPTRHHLGGTHALTSKAKPHVWETVIGAPPAFPVTQKHLLPGSEAQAPCASKVLAQHRRGHLSPSSYQQHMRWGNYLFGKKSFLKIKEQDFSGSLAVKNLTANTQGMVWIPGLGRSHIQRGS